MGTTPRKVARQLTSGKKEIMACIRHVGGVNKELATKITDALDKAFADVLCRKREKGGSKKRSWHWTTPGGQEHFYTPVDGDGNSVTKKRSKWDDYIRVVLGMPRNGKWYRIENSKRLPAESRQKIYHAIRIWLSRHGYNSPQVQMRQNNDGIVVCWQKEN